MKNLISTKSFLVAVALTAIVPSLMACGDDESNPAGPGGPGGTGGTGGTGGSGGTGGTGGTGAGPSGYNFRTEAPAAYDQIDRHGAVEAGTVGIRAGAGLGEALPHNAAFNDNDVGVRDGYNASNPVDDAAGMWSSEIGNSLTFLQGALADDFAGLGLDAADLNQALAQAGPVLVPDAIKYNPANPTAYPNGRALTDQVVDITLAAAFLDLGTHALDTFANIPVNPATNDVPFKTQFPFLADPN